MGGIQALGAGVLPYEKSNAFVFREEATLVRELTNILERRRSISLKWEGKGGREDRRSSDADVANGSVARGLILLFSMPVGVRQAPHGCTEL